MNGYHIFLRLAAALTLLCCLLSSCAGETEIPYADTSPTLSEEELPPAAMPDIQQDTKDYPALAAAVLDGVPTAPATDFSYEETEGGIQLTAYLGTGGKVVLPDTIDGKPVVALGDNLLTDNTSVTALSIPDSVTRIGEAVLQGCRSLQVLQTPQMGPDRQSDGYLAYLFGGLSPELGAYKVGASLDTVILTGSATELSSKAFMSCYRLIMVILPETLQTIGSYAFVGCSSLKYAGLPTGLKQLGDGAFADCTSLTSLTVPDHVERIGLGALMGCTALSELSVPFTGESREGDNTHLGYLFGAEAYVWNGDFLPSSLLRITLRGGDVADYAFYECDKVFDIRLPADCTAIGVRAFHGCSSLLSVTLPDTVTRVGDMAFSDCRWLSSVTLSAGLQEIGMQTFMDCINLTEITLPDTLTMLPPSLFSDCKRLQCVTLGSSLAEVGDHAFHNCISLSQVKYPDGSTPSMAQLTVGTGNAALEAVLTPPDSTGKE